MLLRLPLFVDPRYNAEQDIEFDSREVQSIQETTRSRLFRGPQKVTIVTLSENREYLLDGHLRAQIEAARRVS